MEELRSLERGRRLAVASLILRIIGFSVITYLLILEMNWLFTL